MTRPFVVGLLGGIASGKSTVAGMFRDAGVAVIDADRLAHRCLAEPEIVAAIRAAFGDGVLAADGAIDRRRLGEIAFMGADSKRRLEAIVHPCVRRKIDAELEAISRAGSPRIVLLDVPLLLETDLNARCAARIFVDAPIEERRARVERDRGWARGELDRREIFQKAAEEKRAAAEYTIANVGPLEPLRARVREVLSELELRARGSPAPPEQNLE